MLTTPPTNAPSSSYRTRTRAGDVSIQPAVLRLHDLRANASVKVASAAFAQIWGAARMCDNPEHHFYHIDG